MHYPNFNLRTKAEKYPIRCGELYDICIAKANKVNLLINSINIYLIDFLTISEDINTRSVSKDLKNDLRILKEELTIKSVLLGFVTESTGLNRNKYVTVAYLNQVLFKSTERIEKAFTDNYKTHCIRIEILKELLAALEIPYDKIYPS